MAEVNANVLRDSALADTILLVNAFTCCNAKGGFRGPLANVVADRSRDLQVATLVASFPNPHSPGRANMPTRHPLLDAAMQNPSVQKTYDVYNRTASIYERTNAALGRVPRYRITNSTTTATVIRNEQGKVSHVR